VILPPDDPGRIWYRYAVRLTGHQASDVCLRAATLGVHLEQPVWDLRDAPQWSADYRNTATAFDRVVSLPLYPDLSAHQLDMVVDTLVQVLLEG
jgi:dTDP-4-amino-4,6-dideoxygalactose transaminase